MARISDFINGLLGNTRNTVRQNNQTTQQPNAPREFIANNKEKVGETVDRIKELQELHKKLYEDIDIATRRVEENKQRYGEEHSRTISAQRQLAKLENDYRKSFVDRQNIANDFIRANGLTMEEFRKIIAEYEQFSDEIESNNEKLKNGFSNTSNILNRSFNNIHDDINNFFSEFGVWGALLAAATNRMIEMNTKLVQHNRNMGGTFSNDMLGMDLYGNSTAGNIDTITTGNNINTDDFLRSQEIFKSSKIGLTDTFKDQAVEFRNYGLEVGRLSKFYGVEVATINQISGNLLFNYGAKVKDLGQILQEGKEKAVAAGVSVQDYFAKLKDATNSLGEFYIAGGIKGMENLALYAAKTDSSVKAILGYSEKFKDFTSQYYMQNKAMQLGLQAASVQMTKIWALSNLGRQKEANQIMSTTLVSDLRNNGGFDSTTGDINQKGLLSLKALGIDAEQIGQIQKLNKVWRETGITAEQQLNVDKQSLDTKRKLAQYESQNATVTERLNSLWTKLKALILDPLQNIFAPILNTGLDLLVGVVDVLTFVMKPITYGFGVIGGLLTKIGKIISDGVSWVTSSLESLGVSFEKGSGVFNGLLKTVGTVIAGLLTIGIGIKTFSMLKGVGSLLSSGTSAVGNLLGRGGGPGIVTGARNLVSTGVRGAGSLLTRGVSAFKGLSGGMKGGIAGLVGYGVGQMVGGKGGDTISNIAGDAGMGAMIGSVIPVVGTAVGAAIGGIVGLVRSSWDEIDSIWQDGSKSVWQKIAGTGEALWNNLKEAFTSLWDWFSDLIPDWIKNLLTGGDFNNLKEAVKEGTIEAAGNKDKYEGNNTVRLASVDPTPQIISIMNQRTVKNAYESSKTQEKLIEKQTPINVKVDVKSSMYGNAPKQRINQF